MGFDERGRTGPPNIGVGVDWYRRDDYPRILEIMEDKGWLPAYFDQWEKQALQAERDIRATGQVVYRATIDPENFIAWCTARGRNIDRASRIEYAKDPGNWDIGPKH